MIKLTIFIITFVLSFSGLVSGQSYPLPETAKLVKNDNRKGLWDKNNVELKFVRIIGDIDATEDYFSFYT